MTEPGDPRCAPYDGSMATTTDPIGPDEWDALICEVGHDAITANRTAGYGGEAQLSGAESVCLGLTIAVVIMLLLGWCCDLARWDCDPSDG